MTRYGEYIGEVCPVGLSAEFPFADRVEGLFNHPEGPLTLEVLLGGDSGTNRETLRRIDPVFGQQGSRVYGARGSAHTEPSTEMEKLPSDGLHTHHTWERSQSSSACAAFGLGWGTYKSVAKGCSTTSSGRNALNRWSVGEIHILEPRIVPNARRDYFQPGPHLRNLENHLRPVLRKVAGRCRAASRARNRDQKTLSLIGKIEDTYKLAMSGYLAKDYAAVLVRSALEQIPSVREKALASPLGNRSVTRLDVVEARLNDYNGEPSCHPFGDTPAATVSAYQKMFQALAEVSLSPSAAQELMLAVILQAADTEKSGAGDE